MTIHVLNDVELWFAEHRLRGTMNSLALDDGVDLQDVTVFGDVGRRRIAGLRDAELSFEGFADMTAYDKALYDNLALADVPVTIAPQGSTAGSKAYMMRMLAGEYSMNARVGDPFGFSMSGFASTGNRITPGVIAHNGTVVADGVGAGQQLDVIIAPFLRLEAHLHILGFSNASPTTFTLETDDNPSFTTPTTRVTFDTVVGVGAQRKQLATNVGDVWWRIRWDVPAAGGPSVTFVAAFGINYVN